MNCPCLNEIQQGLGGRILKATSRATIQASHDMCYCPSITCNCPSIACYCPSITCNCPCITCYSPSITCYCSRITCYCPRITCYCPRITCYSPSITCYCPSITCNCPGMQHYAHPRCPSQASCCSAPLPRAVQRAAPGVRRPSSGE